MPCRLSRNAGSGPFSKSPPGDRYPACDQPESADSSGPVGLLTTHRLDPRLPSRGIFDSWEPEKLANSRDVQLFDITLIHLGEINLLSDIRRNRSGRSDR
jgi:hypothetical protein